MTSRINKSVRSGTRARKVKPPHELMLEWCQTGIIEVPVRYGNYYVKEYDGIPVGLRIKIIIAAAPYFSRKLAPIKVPISGAQAKVPSPEEVTAAYKARAAESERVVDKLFGDWLSRKSPADKDNGNVGGDSPQKESK
jgi:hypothetical protein